MRIHGGGLATSEQNSLNWLHGFPFIFSETHTEKVSDMLEIINYEGDSFTKRVEMYYSKRPELIKLIEEIFRSYRSLAERFDHLSKELQSANSTIASVFPDRVPYEMYDDEDDDDNFDFHRDKAAIPKAKSLKKEFRNQAMFTPRKGAPKKSVGFRASGMNKDEALKEIDKLQKEMLALQIEKELMKSSYEYGCKKFNEIENQKRVCDLQYEFEIGSVIDDNEGRTLMANQALKSCQESLDKLKEKHEQSMKAMDQQGKPKSVSSTAELNSMDYDIDNEAKNREDTEASDQQEKPKRIPSTAELDKIVHHVDKGDKLEASMTDLDNMVYDIDEEENKILDIQALQRAIEEKLQLGSNESLTMKQLVKKIDNILKRVIRLETAVLSEKAQLHEIDTTGFSEGVIFGPDAKAYEGTEELELVRSSLKDIGIGLEPVGENKADVKHLFVASDSSYKDSEKGSEQVGENKADKKYFSIASDSSYKPDNDPEKSPEPVGENKADKKYLSVASDSSYKPDSDTEKSPEPVGEIHSDSSHKLDIDSKQGQGTGLEPVGENKDYTKSLSETAISILNAEVDQPETDEEEELYRMQRLRKDFTRRMRRKPDKLHGEDSKNLQRTWEYMLRGTSVHQIKKYQTSVKDLRAELSKLRKNQEGGKQQSMKSAARPIYYHMREIKTELTSWLENNEVLKDEVQDQHSTLCNFQDEITRVTNASDHSGETGISLYEAAKFQGEVLNMKQEIKRVSEQLISGFTHARQLKEEVERTMADLDKEPWSSPSMNSLSHSRSWRPRIPLQSFLFGIKFRGKKKKKKTLLKQLSYIVEPKESSEWTLGFLQLHLFNFLGRHCGRSHFIFSFKF
ncbi:hypothetical protein F3Y22_tig00002840pilonHSYRG00955 [Hibiscus syriacus]|uniref:NAB domain-containing protein n=1 Tax=Hibiscus syriacus TaxID=106335 RepID=A0A6A3CVT3_HIBSY|nr:hypothetical protein F3Y22_tig00002840pilonHSYRG00955 [Hibiscus syriacus]